MKTILFLLSLLMIGLYSSGSIAESGAKALFYGGRDSETIHTSTSNPKPSPISTTKKSPPRTKKQPIQVTKKKSPPRTKKSHVPAKKHTKKRDSPIYADSDLGIPPRINTPPTVLEYRGIKYWIELKRGNDLMHVSPSFQFHSGDRFKLGVMANQNGYVYVVNVGTTGKINRLHPLKPIDNNGYVHTSTPYLFPIGNGMMRFDDNAGIEILKIAFSPKPLTDTNYVQSSNYDDNYTNTYHKIDYTENCGSKDILRTDTCEQTGSKDIFVEDDTSGNVTGTNHPAGYSVAPLSYIQQGNPIIKTLELKHQ